MRVNSETDIHRFEIPEQNSLLEATITRLRS